MKKALLILLIIYLSIRPVEAFAASHPPVVADGAVLVDADSGQILYEKNKDTKFYPASTTKIMTALLVLEHCKLDDKVIIGKKPSSFIDGSKIYLFLDEEFTVDQLLHALLIASANDVALAFAEHVAGSEAAFADLMNKKAEQLGCLNTHFANPHGLYDPAHYTTAYDLSLIAREAMKNETFRQIVNTKSYSIPPTNKQPEQRPLNTNDMLILNTKYHVDGANGIKVGYTSEAGHSFVGSAYRNGRELIVVLLHDKKPGLFEDASSLLNYGFNDFSTVKELSQNSEVTSIRVTDSETQIPLLAKEDLYYTYPKDEVPDISKNIIITASAVTSITKGEKLGYAEYFDHGKKIGTVDLLAAGNLNATLLSSYKSDENGEVKKSFNIIASIPASLFLLAGSFALYKIFSSRKRSMNN
ncbi:MAG TPA: D-alanyl-D-alanine carboxypeptidase [Clostridiaceae bacterium]|nr:D-alanyl-D-alanine carboxypeptidase [Clostridiaceae bacterium]